MDGASRAKLTVVPLLHVPGGAIYQLVCVHGAESLEYDPGQIGIGEPDVIRTLLLRHYANEGCRCPAGLWRLYGLRLTAHWRLGNLRDRQEAS